MSGTGSNVKAGHCACGAPATHFFPEGKIRTRAITRACCSCFDQEMTRVTKSAGQCACGHPKLLHEVGGCRMPWCSCEVDYGLTKENPPPVLPGRAARAG